MGIVLLARRTFLKNNKNAIFLWLVEQSISLLPLLFIVFAIRAFWIEPYKIPSGSMLPGLKNGDFILVNKYIYGFRSPINNAQMFGVSTPKRGDNLVFYPPGSDLLYIKRVIGLGGDTVNITNNGDIYVNNKLVSKSFIKAGSDSFSNRILPTNIYDINLDNKNFVIQESQQPISFLTYSGSYKVPENHYFVLGDNRDNSSDSRSCFGVGYCNQPKTSEVPYPSGWSSVPHNRVIGKAVYKWMYWKDWSSLPTFKFNGTIK